MQASNFLQLHHINKSNGTSLLLVTAYFSQECFKLRVENRLYLLWFA